MTARAGRLADTIRQAMVRQSPFREAIVLDSSTWGEMVSRMEWPTGQPMTLFGFVVHVDLAQAVPFVFIVR